NSVVQEQDPPTEVAILGIRERINVPATSLPQSASPNQYHCSSYEVNIFRFQVFSCIRLIYSAINAKTEHIHRASRRYEHILFCECHTPICRSIIDENNLNASKGLSS